MKTRIIMLAAVTLLTALDQLVKFWARTNLAAGETHVVIDGLIGLRFATNTGAAFGILQGARWFFVVFTIAVFGLIIWYDYKLPLTKKNLSPRAALVLIAAGGLGNFIDRLLFGYVVDMFQFLFVQFPIFNVADILLVVGTIAYGILAVFGDFLPEKPEKKETAA